MPIFLNTPWNPGDFDPGVTYPRAQIVALSIYPEEETINITVEFGDMVSGVWQPCQAGHRRSFLISGDDFNAIIAENIQEEDNGKIYAGAKRVAYNWLTVSGLLLGTVE